jgi:nicotinate-nucleotide pyrophosphorylase (carboxylating)
MIGRFTKAAKHGPSVEPLPPELYEPLVRATLGEDLGLGGDITSDATIPHGTRALSAFVSRENGVLAGLDVALCALRSLDPTLSVEVAVQDGDRVTPGLRIAALAGDARAMLSAERTALNFLCHLSGIATTTAAYVEAIGDAHASICETRKTLPGLRSLEKYAVRAGGGRNHRLRLDDAVLIKDNHIAVAGGVAQALAAVRNHIGHLVKVEIEVDTLAQLDEVLAHAEGVDAVLLDNFQLADLREAVKRVAGRIVVEASGGVNLESVAAIAATGVDVISSGGLTHSAKALDIGLDIVAA